MYVWQWGIIWHYKIVFLQGILTTLEVTAVSLIAGTLLGGLVAALGKSKQRWLVIAANIYIQFFRAIPILVLLIWIFYVVPILIDWRASAFTTACVTLTLHLSAFAAETIRSGVESISQYQLESGLVLGIPHWQVMRRIILPQAIRSIAPNLLGLYIELLKNSSLASIIAVNELLHRANILISDTFRPLEIYTTVGVLYVLLVLPCAFLVHQLEARWKRSVRVI